MTELGRHVWDRGRFEHLDPIGVIDIGSNSVRLVVYEGAVRSPTPLFNEKVLCGLGRAVATTGRLGHESVARALEALARFRTVNQILGTKKVFAIATAAVRDAQDGPEFILRGQEAAGVEIQVLSGEREAQLAANGILMGFRDVDGIAGDLGGGSLELIDIGQNRRQKAATLPLGGLRLIDLAGGRMDRAATLVQQNVAAVDWLARGEGRSFYAVGGTWRALAKLHMETSRYPLRVMHGYRVPARQALAFCELLRSKPGDVERMAGVTKARREVLPYGALVLENVIRLMKPKDVMFSVFGIREGLLFGELSEAEQSVDPLLAFSEDYARLRSRSVDHARELCQWSDLIFVPPGPKESEAERRLRHAACLLSDISWRAHPDYRGEQSLNVIAHAALGGIDHEDRIFLALSVFYRHVGGEERNADDISERLKEVVTKRTARRARLVGAAIRAAHMLSIGIAGVINQTQLRYEDDRLALLIPASLKSLTGERLSRRFEAFTRLLDRRAEIRIV